MGRQPINVAPAPEEDAQNAQGADGCDQPAQERVVASEGFAGNADGPQSNDSSGADRLKNDEPRQKRLWSAVVGVRVRQPANNGVRSQVSCLLWPKLLTD